MTSVAPAGWYPDPSGAPGHRWWDGQAWSDATAPVTQPAFAMQSNVPVGTEIGYATSPQPVQPSQNAWQPSSANGYPVAQSRPAAATGWAVNRLALITIGVVALYIVIAVETRFVIFGFLPLALSLRSKRAGEPLAPFAIGAAMVSIALAAVLIFGH
jgi:Protein of unknown function (DUF2510)